MPDDQKPSEAALRIANEYAGFWADVLLTKLALAIDTHAKTVAEVERAGVLDEVEKAVRSLRLLGVPTIRYREVILSRIESLKKGK